MNVYLSPAMRRLTVRRMGEGPWRSHIPFAYDLVAALKPRTVVDIGACPDLSYFASCQSVLEHELDALCYCVGEWDASHLDDVSAHNRRFYVGFSYLMQMPFRQALSHFSDESIDLVHFDCIDQAAGSADFFEAWYPKLRPGGVFLIHGTAVVESDAACVWRECMGHHDAFNFNHGSGLGVIRKPPGRVGPGSDLMEILFGDDEVDRERLGALYAHIARFHEMSYMVNPNQFSFMSRQKDTA